MAAKFGTQMHADDGLHLGWVFCWLGRKSTFY